MSAADVDAYLAALPRADHRAPLTALRARLKALLPDHVECLSHAMPGFRQPRPQGKMVAGYASFARNLGYYPHSGSIVGQFPDLTAGFKTTQGAISFTPEHPLPDALLTRLIAARQAEIAATGR
jgi:uncharacterized protein YdhG (YjbR/CyaY superfamily)